MLPGSPQTARPIRAGPLRRSDMGWLGRHLAPPGHGFLQHAAGDLAQGQLLGIRSVRKLVKQGRGDARAQRASVAGHHAALVARADGR